jgi:hypothetical protein
MTDQFRPELFDDSAPASSITKTGRHDIAEILLKVALNTIKQTSKQTNKQTNELMRYKAIHLEE